MLIIPPPPITTLFPYTTLFRSPEVRVTGRPAQNPQREEGERLSLDVRGLEVRPAGGAQGLGERVPQLPDAQRSLPDRKSTRLNSSHANISYAVFCLKKKK